MTNWDDKITLSIEVECNADDRTVVAEAIEIAVEDLVASWEKGAVGTTVVRVTG